ncbi:hypothetical protein Dimus_012289 [Dionaea muscipula]
MTSGTKKSRVTVHSKLTVVSSIPVEPGQSFPLSAVDHAMGRHTLHLVFYYSPTVSSDSGSGPLDFERIRPTLCELLSLYPVVTGRLAVDGEGNWELKCTDAGVRMLRAKVETKIDEWLRTADADEEMDLTVWEDLPPDPSIWSPFRIQINEFEGGGAAIGLSCTHLLADPTCATLILKAWTEAHRHEGIAHPPFIHPAALRRTRSLPADPEISSKSAMYYESKAKQDQSACSSVNMATVTFSFSDAVIQHHLSQVHANFPKATPFDLLAALFWTRIVAAAAASPNPIKEKELSRSLSFCIDFRKRLDAPLPYGYFGNALHFSQLTLPREDLDGGDLGHVAELVHRHVSGIEEEEIWSSIDWLYSKKGKYGAPFRMYGPELTCVNMEHMIADAPTSTTGSTTGGRTKLQPFMYTAMFEEGEKPDHVSYRIGNVEGEGLIIVMPSPEEGMARRVAVTLPENQMAELRKDQVILNLQPKLLLSGGGAA